MNNRGWKYSVYQRYANVLLMSPNDQRQNLYSVVKVSIGKLYRHNLCSDKLSVKIFQRYCVEKLSFVNCLAEKNCRRVTCVCDFCWPVKRGMSRPLLLLLNYLIELSVDRNKCWENEWVSKNCVWFRLGSVIYRKLPSQWGSREFEETPQGVGQWRPSDDSYESICTLKLDWWLILPVTSLISYLMNNEN